MRRVADSSSVWWRRRRPRAGLDAFSVGEGHLIDAMVAPSRAAAPSDGRDADACPAPARAPPPGRPVVHPTRGRPSEPLRGTRPLGPSAVPASPFHHPGPGRSRQVFVESVTGVVPPTPGGLRPPVRAAGTSPVLSAAAGAGLTGGRVVAFRIFEPSVLLGPTGLSGGRSHCSP